MTVLPKAVYRFNAIPIKIPMAFFTELEQLILKSVWKHKRPRMAKTILRKKNRAGGIILPDFHQNIMILAQKQTHRSMEQDRKPRNKPMAYGQLIYDKGSRNMQCRKDSLFNKWCWEN